ncbi:hypothetical protein LUZ60_010496 [Juncus effusus]|nr:hypothetical protein LUZ60_010496 [Juncus effusus]
MKSVTKLTPTNTLASLFSHSFDPNSLRSWLSAITDLSVAGDHTSAFSAFSSFRRLSLLPSPPFFLPLLRSASSLRCLRFGRQLHLLSLRLGFLHNNPFVVSSLVHMYSSCLEIRDARKVFEEAGLFNSLNHVVWTALIAGYIHNGLPHMGFELFRDFVKEEGREAIDAASAVSVLSACSRISDKNAAKFIHGLVYKLCLNMDIGVCNTLMDAYTKGGNDLESARKMFDEMPERDVISWNSIIALYAQNGFSSEALDLYIKMSNNKQVRYNAVTLSVVLLACGQAGALNAGKCVHNQAVRMSLEDNLYVGTALVGMYCKCGRVEMAKRTFNHMKKRNVLTWSALIAGFGMQGRGKEALKVFDGMLQSKIRPNYVTFISVLSACSHAGLLEEGKFWFNSMKRDFCIEPRIEHFGCMVNLLGRAGCLNEAHDLIKGMKIKPDSVVWGSLLSACRVNTNVELAEICAKSLFRLDPRNCGYYVILANIYRDVGRWKDVEKMKHFIKKKDIVKTPGYSMVELKGKIHVFLVGDKRHAQHKDVYIYLEELFVKMEENGYIPDTSSILHDVDEEEKRKLLRVHSEKLAVCFAIIHTANGTPIHVVKNLRMCGDCHNAIKLICKIVRREIVVRDSNRFHVFKDGLCSCGDYW